MDIVDRLDLHKRECQAGSQGARRHEHHHRPPHRDEAPAHLSARPSASSRAPRILLEASTESEWVARHPSRHLVVTEVIVADPNFRADVRHPHPTHQDRQTRCAGADGGVRTPAPIGLPIGWLRWAPPRAGRTRRRARCPGSYPVPVYATLKPRRSCKGATACACRRAPAKWCSARITALPLVALARGRARAAARGVRPTCSTSRSEASDTPLGRVGADRSGIVGLLLTVPGVGPVTAAAFVATVDDIRRFPSAHFPLEAYLGLVPSERCSSGERRQLRAHHQDGLGTRGCGGCSWSRRRGAFSAPRPTRPPRSGGWASGIAARRGKLALRGRCRLQRAGWPAFFFALWRDGNGVRCHARFRGLASGGRRSPAAADRLRSPRESPSILGGRHLSAISDRGSLPMILRASVSRDEGSRPDTGADPLEHQGGGTRNTTRA